MGVIPIGSNDPPWLPRFGRAQMNADTVTRSIFGV